MSSKALPFRPNLDHYRKRAKQLVKAHKAGDLDAGRTLAEHHPRLGPRAEDALAGDLSLSEAQLVVAREYGFESWPKLKRHIERVLVELGPRRAPRPGDNSVPNELTLEDVDAEVGRLVAAYRRGEDEPSRRAQRQVDRHKSQSGLFSLLIGPQSEEARRDADPELLAEQIGNLVSAEYGHSGLVGLRLWAAMPIGAKDIWKAVTVGDIDSVRRLLEEDPRLAYPRPQPRDEPFIRGASPLYLTCYAASAGENTQGNHLEIARLLLDAGADPDGEQEGPMVASPLWAAASNGDPEFARLVLERGGNPDGPDGKRAPMAWGLRFRGAATCELLAEYGATLDLRFAAGLGRIDVVRSFFEPDGSLGIRALDLYQPLPYARKPQSATAQQVLQEAWIFACMNERLEAMDFLLERGVDIDAMPEGFDHRGSGCHWAASMAVGALEHLIERGADLGVRDGGFNATPLGWARQNGHKRAIALLEKHDAPV